MTLLRADDLYVRLGGKTILSHVSLHLEKGSWLMVVGPNGAGKSTLVRALTGILPYEGQVSLLGRDGKTLKGKALARIIGVLAQGGIASSAATVYETVALGRYAHKKSLFSPLSKEDERQITLAMERTKVTELAEKKLKNCSGGEVQRVLLSQLMAQNPQILVLDEPTNHLDLPYQKQLFQWVDAWRKEGEHAVIAVVHDLSLARRFGTQGLLLRNGKMLACGQDALTDENLQAAYQMDVACWERELARVWQKPL